MRNYGGIPVEFLRSLFRTLDASMEVPTLFGWFHIMWLVLSIGGAVALSLWHRKHPADRQRKVLLVTTLIVIALEIYKQLNFSVLYEEGLSWSYAWYIFPLQFCSTPMYVGLLAALTKKGKIHESACAYMATFSLFAGTAVMIYPGDVFIETIGINIQTMVCHGSMIFLAIYLMATGYVKLGIKTVLKALPIFAFFLLLAIGLNEWAFQTGLLESHNFNMFYISPYQPGHLPIYGDIQNVVPYPWSLFIYIIGFAAAAYVMQLLAILVRLIARKTSKKPVAA